MSVWSYLAMTDSRFFLTLQSLLTRQSASHFYMLISEDLIFFLNFQSLFLACCSAAVRHLSFSALLDVKTCEGEDAF